MSREVLPADTSEFWVQSSHFRGRQPSLLSLRFLIYLLDLWGGFSEKVHVKSRSTGQAGVGASSEVSFLEVK